MSTFQPAEMLPGLAAHGSVRQHCHLLVKEGEDSNYDLKKVEMILPDSLFNPFFFFFFFKVLNATVFFLNCKIAAGV